MHEANLNRAIALAAASISEGGGPFGAVVVKDGAVVAEGSNAVTRDHDPTAHAEVVAIRGACEALGTHDLSGCVLYASCQPCPMCLAACYWARLTAVYYAATQADPVDAGFDDAHIRDQLALPETARSLPQIHLALPNASEPFLLWNQYEDRIEY